MKVKDLFESLSEQDKRRVVNKMKILSKLNEQISNYKNIDDVSYQDINEGDIVEFSRIGFKPRPNVGDRVRFGPIVGVCIQVRNDLGLLKVQGNSLKDWDL